MGGNHASWFKQVAVLSKAYQVITFDHRGFGNSTDNENIGRSGFVTDLLALLDHLKITKAALVGQSMGGGTMITFASLYPERVSGLVIADSLHGLVESDDVKCLMDKARADTKNLTQITRVLGKKYVDESPESAFLYQQLNSFNSVDRRTLVGKYASEKIAAEQLSAINVPIMFLAGQDDILFPIEAIRLMQVQVDNSFIVEFDNCGHSAFFEKPVEFNDSLLSFLQMAGLEPKSDKALSNSSGYIAA